MEATNIVAKNDDKANEEKSLAELVYDAYKKNEANYPYLMKKSIYYRKMSKPRL